jgi:hypothetical protein
MLQLAPRGEIAVPMSRVDDLAVWDVKAGWGQLPLGCRLDDSGQTKPRQIQRRRLLMSRQQIAQPIMPAWCQ